MVEAVLAHDPIALGIHRDELNDRCRCRQRAQSRNARGHDDFACRGIERHILEALLRHAFDDIQEHIESREATQPIKSRTGGSTFQNPPGHKAWELIDAAGCRGLKVGNAQVSELHCNFLINLGGASAAEIETLGETVRTRVKENSGVDLQWEIKRIGIAATAER